MIVESLHIDRSHFETGTDGPSSPKAPAVATSASRCRRRAARRDPVHIAGGRRAAWHAACPTTRPPAALGPRPRRRDRRALATAEAPDLRLPDLAGERGRAVVVPRPEGAAGGLGLLVRLP